MPDESCRVSVDLPDDPLQFAEALRRLQMVAFICCLKCKKEIPIWVDTSGHISLVNASAAYYKHWTENHSDAPRGDTHNAL